MVVAALYVFDVEDMVARKGSGSLVRRERKRKKKGKGRSGRVKIFETSSESCDPEETAEEEKVKKIKEHKRRNI